MDYLPGKNTKIVATSLLTRAGDLIEGIKGSISFFIPIFAADIIFSWIQ